MFNLIPFLLISALAFVSCGADFPYRWYGIDPQAGLIIGPSSKEDEPITVCQPSGEEKGKCIVMKVGEFERLMEDYLEKTERLKECERPK